MLVPRGPQAVDGGDEEGLVLCSWMSVTTQDDPASVGGEETCGDLNRQDCKAFWR